LGSGKRFSEALIEGPPSILARHVVMIIGLIVQEIVNSINARTNQFNANITDMNLEKKLPLTKLSSAQKV